MLKITVLLENSRSHASLRCSKWLSLLLEDKTTKILFDTGSNKDFLINAQMMNIDLRKIDVIVLSHGHIDHCGGLKHYPYAAQVICHPLCFQERFFTLLNCLKVKKLSSDLATDLPSHLFFKFSQAPYWILPHFLFLGEIPVEYRKHYGHIYEKGELKKDYIYDDSALVYLNDKGLVIITGCCHVGIKAIIEYAKAVTGIQTIVGIIGGLHLRAQPIATMMAWRKYIKALNLSYLYGCHCTGIWGKMWLPKCDLLSTGQSVSIL